MALQNLTDEELMAQYQIGSEEAFYLLYTRHAPKVYGFLKRRIFNNPQIEDIHQEVFVKMHKSKSLYNRSMPVLPWLFTITRSVMIDHLRKNKNVKYVDGFDFDKLVQESVPESAENPEPGYLNQVREVIENLPQNQKAAIQLRYVDNKTFEEIALQLKTSPLNVRKLISRGIQRIKQLINEGRDS